jgi:hypothetical protein
MSSLAVNGTTLYYDRQLKRMFLGCVTYSPPP